EQLLRGLRRPRRRGPDRAAERHVTDAVIARTSQVLERLEQQGREHDSLGAQPGVIVDRGLVVVAVVRTDADRVADLRMQGQVTDAGGEDRPARSAQPEADAVTDE